jgi:hypothetical protein
MEKEIYVMCVGAMAQIFNSPLANSPILELDLLKRVEIWSTKERNTIIQKFVIDSSFTFENSSVKSKVYSPTTKLMVSVITSILGYVDDTEIDEVTLVIMNEVMDTENVSKFDFTGFIANAIHFQLSSFEELKSFRYQSYLSFLFYFLSLTFIRKEALN